MKRLVILAVASALVTTACVAESATNDAATEVVERSGGGSPSTSPPITSLIVATTSEAALSDVPSTDGPKDVAAPLSIECEHTPGTGVLADDITATWAFMYNASPWSYTFEPDGTGVGHYLSDIVGGTASGTFDVTWELGGSVVAVDAVVGPTTLIFRAEEADGWRVAFTQGSTGELWRRCS